MSVAAAELVAHAPSTLRARVECALRTAVYLALAIPLGVVHLSVLVPLLAFDRSRVWRLADLERALANRLLNARIPPLPSRGPATASPPGSALALVVLRLPVAAAAGAACAIFPALTVQLTRYSVEGFAGSERSLGPWQLDPAVGAILSVLAFAAAVISVAVLDAAARPLRGTVIRLLASTAVVGVAVREALAERIGDESLAIAYWLPDRSVFVDEHGLPVTLPEPGSGRAWTAVEHEGRRVAAIIHAAELDARPELVRAAATGSVLALQNERLKADLRARIEELRASRARIVEAADEARRRLERDLHDGAQQQLVALSLDLRTLRNRVAADPDAVELTDAVLERLSEALTELRELARGIHPAVLTDRGLEPAIEALAARAPIAVELDIGLDDRLAPTIEAAAYFVVAEALTNVAKYAQATRARVSIRREGELIQVEVADDGVGGTDLERGSGLRGLEDRVAAIDGSLEVVSPAGQGTVVRARVPLGVPRA